MSGGVSAALDQAVQGEADMAEVVQAGLFEELEPCETGNLTAPSPLAAALPSARKPGRPKGSKNRRTEAVTAWLLTQHRHPLSVMMEAYSMSPADFAKAIGIAQPDSDTLLDIVKLQLRMAEAVAPYVAQKLPQAVQVEGGAALTLNFGGVTLNGPQTGVSSPARGEAPEISVGGGMAVRLGQVGREKSDDDLED
ncbi:hypothetical protein HNP47_000103 [Brevundimonas vesicularis]|uniref:Uncharacterized protein n=1 Tax=Brevundimonas vesicularis TaxID=41276 RepID=A0A7W9FRB9_BREVE|nr:hypothetical protein [Brevundimonas vesicularis]MBB5770134.1 hypothetical protein [Brevundimonas vesicularis]